MIEICYFIIYNKIALGQLEKRLNSVPSQGTIHGFESRIDHHIESIGLIQ